MGFCNKKVTELVAVGQKLEVSQWWWGVGGGGQVDALAQGVPSTMWVTCNS